MRRYGQRCPVSRALDVIGERWALLVVRELLLGPKRYTDLQRALPGIGTNVLADRLADLQAAGIVSQRTLPPPTPAVIYELTEAGDALGPIVGALRRWGEQYAPAPNADDAVRPAWVLQSAAARSPSLSPGRVCEVQIDDEAFELTGREGEVLVRFRPANRPDATIAMPAPTLYELASGRIDAKHIYDHASITGDPDVTREAISMLASGVQQPVKASRSSAPAKP
jgi:DNA-binding HxlR family transcriptional regulator